MFNVDDELDTMAFPQTEVKSTDILIVGGGMSGLSAAIWISKNTNHRCIVVEKSDKIGGSSRLYVDRTQPN